MSWVLCYQNVQKRYRAKQIILFSMKKGSKVVAVFWVVAPQSVVEVYQHFMDTCCCHHKDDEWLWWWKQQVLLKGWLTFTRLQSATTQKTAGFKLAAMRTWNLPKGNNVVNVTICLFLVEFIPPHALDTGITFTFILQIMISPYEEICSFS
jgi:hypothetical protein